jgi:hypothetical protein
MGNKATLGMFGAEAPIFDHLRDSPLDLGEA